MLKLPNYRPQIQNEEAHNSSPTPRLNAIKSYSDTHICVLFLDIKWPKWSFQIYSLLYTSFSSLHFAAFHPVTLL